MSSILKAALIASAAVYPFGPAAAEPPEVFNVRDLLDEPLGVPAEGHSQIEDLLIDEGGRITHVVVEAEGLIEQPERPRQVPWSEVQVIGGKGDLIANLDVDTLQRFPIFYGPVAGTLGGPNAVLASKLLDAEVENRLGSDVGEVYDVIFNSSGLVQTVVIATSQGPMHTPWAQIIVRPERPAVSAADEEVEAMVVWSR